MAKRFTDSEKWKHQSFRDKCPKCKLFWIYLLDNCDYAGIWQVDFNLASFCIGESLNVEFIKQSLKDDVVVLDDGKRWFIPSFIRFQYGRQLSKKQQVHQRVIKEILDRELEECLAKVEVEIVDDIQSATALRARISNKYRISIYTRDEFTCQYCSKQFKQDELTIDHIVPAIKGGQNNEENLVTACRLCNGKKSILDVEEFLSRNADLKPTQKILEKCVKVDNSLSGVDNGLSGVDNFLSTLKEEEEEEEEEEDKDEEEEKDKEERENKEQDDRLPTVGLFGEETEIAGGS
jgi:hypothetical protein